MTNKNNGGPASDKIQQARRAAFEEWFTETYTASKLSPRQTNCGILTGGYADPRVNLCWLGFNAALDCVVIELPSERKILHLPTPDENQSYNEALENCIDSIDSTNLGIKVK